MSTASDAAARPTILDVTEETFAAEVIERSHDTPVVVDFWAAWCGPCRTLGPMLESAVEARGGEVVLAKVDVDTNPGLAQRYRVQGIPHVLGVRDGTVVAQFTGVIQPRQIESFIDDLLPSEADQAVARARVADPAAAESELRRALELEPTNREAAIGLAELLVDRDADEAIELLTPHRPDPAAERILTQIALARAGGDDPQTRAARIAELEARVDAGDADDSTLLALGRTLAAQGDYDRALEVLVDAVAVGGESRDEAREQLVALFTVLGDDDPRVTATRPKLARALF